MTFKTVEMVNRIRTELFTLHDEGASCEKDEAVWTNGSDDDVDAFFEEDLRGVLAIVLLVQSHFH